MRIKAILIALLFGAAIFTGTATAAETMGSTYAFHTPDTAPNRGLDGQWGVPELYGTPSAYLAPRTPPTAQVHTGIKRISHIIGRQVYSPRGGYLGEIQNLEIAQDGQAEYVILSRGGPHMDDLVPIPWHTADLHPQNHKLTAEITPRQFRDAPGFSRAQWAQMNNPTYENRVDGYYSTRPRNR